MTSEEIAKCEAWLNNKRRTWQTLRRGQWHYQFHEKTLVRYVEEATMDEDIVPLLLEYLTADDGNGNYLCTQTLSLYKQGISPAWTPINAWYEVSNKSVGGVHAVRLYHALVENPDDASEMHVVEDGCAYKVSLTYYWRQAEVMEVPQSESGISYRITSLNRDNDTGLYSYVLEKRERKQQDIPEYTTGVTTTQRTGEEVHLGVRGDLDVGGQEASVGDGRTVTRKVTKNPDCTHDVHNGIKQELAAPRHSVSTTASLTGVTQTVTDRNMPEPLDDTVLDIGERVENSKTEGGLWNRVKTSRVLTVFLWLGEACRKTLFGHTHSRTTVQGRNPGFTHVEEAGGGVVHRKSVSRTSDGAYKIDEDTTTENTVRNASRTYAMTLHGMEERVTHKSVAPDAVPDPGDLELGERLTLTQTEGKMVDVTEDKSPTRGAGTIGESCRRDYYTHHHAETENVAGADAPDPETSFETGRITSVSVSKQSNGTANVSTDVSEAKPQLYRYSYRREDGAYVHVVQWRNQPTKWGGYPDEADGLHVNDSVNAYGLHDGSAVWLTNAPKVWGPGASAFIKHGVAQTWTQVKYNRRVRAFYHRNWTIQKHHIYGDAYSDYLNDQLRANPARDTPGVMTVNLISRFKDRDGNNLAEWEWVELTAVDAAWVLCTASCKHPMKVTTAEDFNGWVATILGKGATVAEQGQAQAQVSRTLRDLPIALSMALTGRSREEAEAVFRRGVENGEEKK